MANDDLISRQAAIDVVNSETVSTNPEHFKSSEKFIKFMDDTDIASFGKWQWANGFNTALVATTVQLKKLPSAQPEIIRCKDCKWWRDTDHTCKEHSLVSPMRAEEFCSRGERKDGDGMADDTISRAAAINVVRTAKSKGEAHRMLVQLPSAQPEPQWIPCSERMPEEKDAGILKKLGTNKRSDYVIATVDVKGERMTVTACTYDGVWHWDMKYAFPDFKVVAWMPLPEPYKGDNNG